VKKALQSSHVVSTTPLIARTVEQGDEPAQIHQIVDMVEALLRRAHEDIAQKTEALKQVQGVPFEQRSAIKREKLALQV
jgi:hypothetical protein